MDEEAMQRAVEWLKSEAEKQSNKNVCISITVRKENGIINSISPSIFENEGEKLEVGCQSK
jgi:hypothetical protein